MADGQTAETKASQDLVEDAYQFNLKSLIEQHEKFMGQINLLAIQSLANNVALANQVAQNNADTSNLVNKQAVAHRDVAIASEWNLAGQAAIDAIAASVAEKLASTISPTIPGPSTSPGVATPHT